MKNAKKQNLENLIKKIIHAFETVSKPAINNIINHECAECLELRDSFSKYSWQKIPRDIIKKNYENLPLFSAEGFHYYLPAYLLKVLELDNPEDQLTMYTIFALYNKGNEKNELRYKSRIEFFSKEQIEALLSFLQYLQNDPRYEIHRQDIDWGIEQWSSKL